MIKTIYNIYITWHTGVAFGGYAHHSTWLFYKDPHQFHLPGL